MTPVVTMHGDFFSIWSGLSRFFGHFQGLFLPIKSSPKQRQLLLPCYVIHHDSLKPNPPPAKAPLLSP